MFYYLALAAQGMCFVDVVGPQQLRHQGARERGGEDAARPGAPGGGWGFPWEGGPHCAPWGAGCGKGEKSISETSGLSTAEAF
jgi:hypothetical protein